MSIVAPLSAIGGGVLPVVWGLLRGERPSGLALVGVAVALVAAAIVGGARSMIPPRPSRRGWRSPSAPAPELDSVSSSSLLAESSSGSGMWPVFIARCVSVPLAPRSWH